NGRNVGQTGGGNRRTSYGARSGGVNRGDGPLSSAGDARTEASGGSMDRRVESDDASLVARTLAGDPSGFAAPVARPESDVYHLALRSLRQREAAEDVAQEAFVRSYRPPAQYAPLRPFGAWMHAITARLCIVFHRRRRVKTVSLTRPEEGS